MKFSRVGQRWFVATTFFGDDVQNHGLVERFQMFESFHQQANVMTIDRTIIAHAKLLEQHVRE